MDINLDYQNFKPQSNLSFKSAIRAMCIIVVKILSYRQRKIGCTIIEINERHLLKVRKKMCTFFHPTHTLQIGSCVHLHSTGVVAQWQPWNSGRKNQMNNKHPHQHKVHLQIFLQANGGRRSPPDFYIYIGLNRSLMDSYKNFALYIIKREVILNP